MVSHSHCHCSIFIPWLSLNEPSAFASFGIKRPFAWRKKEEAYKIPGHVFRLGCRLTVAGGGFFARRDDKPPGGSTGRLPEATTGVIPPAVAVRVRV